MLSIFHLQKLKIKVASTSAHFFVTVSIEIAATLRVFQWQNLAASAAAKEQPVMTRTSSVSSM